ncbi:type II toxin-antitoxin system RelE/ParE family toxin [Salmonella enterica]|nr:type II toxin-antitoxin system RelE/ParE family toxin [Salmonella enterica]ECU0035144.1 type II toxin-antitoxin system RelE/ParE family toxin [Salmonella enterica subsp. enterica serovar Eastbourne]EAR4614426.1 type II toxin-antitoxin system RelE/ParE family toxin [Salmonella enterica]EAR7813665.1 type II toxin-antitoxin system RelE/ParE family toxin [Salmonella enterica]EDH3357087.1 type II toxin-antitoxin system RelE/ParE family toxin [Salmonella enterica]
MTAYILTTDAEADLRGIIRYTRKQWGTAQVRRYIARLEHAIAGLAAGRGPFKDMSELFPELRMMRCEHHYAFYLPRRSAPALVVAILHERMDLIVRLTERLNIES